MLSGMLMKTATFTILMEIKSVKLTPTVQLRINMAGSSAGSEEPPDWLLTKTATLSDISAKTETSIKKTANC